MIKKKFKIVLILIIGIIIGSCISVYATYNYFASDVKYKKKDGTEISVENALNELYSNDLKKEHMILYNNKGLSLNYTYTIKEEDLNYKEILICASGVNYSTSVSDAYVNVTNDNIDVISNDSTYRYLDGGKNVSTQLYMGVIKNIILNDTITIKGYYGTIIKIIGIK